MKFDSVEEYKDAVNKGLNRLHDRGWYHVSFTDTIEEYMTINCIICGTSMHGERREVTGMHEDAEDAEIVGYSCFHCVQYISNGHISHDHAERLESNNSGRSVRSRANRGR